jgi:hypothetical protein
MAMVRATNYADFLNRKIQLTNQHGFKPLWLPDFLRDFQASLTDWSIRKGRAAVLADCGLGKTPMGLVWSANVVRQTNKPVLIVAPLAVSHQFVREGEKFGIECRRSADGKKAGEITVTNYQRLHKFDPDEYSGVVCDEASAIKNASGKTRKEVTEFMRRVPYRLMGTATAAPNDYFEVGTLSDALGYLGYQDMLTMYFKEESKKDFLGWGRKTFRFRGHAETPFWRWVCSWARACRKPSDLGFSNDGYDLPRLIENEILIETKAKRDGMLFSLPARDLREQREERRVTLKERCEAVREIVERNDEPAVVWCHLNPEGDLLEKIIAGAVQVKGSQPDELKEERLVAFSEGQIKRLIIKPKIGAFGLNWQHCHRVATFPSHSFEQYYQLVRRCWRFGQEHDVTVDVVATPGEIGVLRNMQRKANAADRMFDSLTRYMVDALAIDRTQEYSEEMEVPAWL